MVVSTFLAMSLQTGLATDANAQSQRGYGAHCYGTPEQCMRGYRAARPAPRQQAQPRGYGYVPPQRSQGREYDYPSFGSQRWWQQQEDRD
jgi:hypothetical protein